MGVAIHLHLLTAILRPWTPSPGQDSAPAPAFRVRIIVSIATVLHPPHAWTAAGLRCLAQWAAATGQEPPFVLRVSAKDMACLDTDPDAHALAGLHIVLDIRGDEGT